MVSPSQVHTSLAFAPPLALKLSFSKSPLTSTRHLSSLVSPDLLLDTADLSSFLKFLNLAYRPPYSGFPLTSLTTLPHSPSLVSDNFSDFLVLVCPKIWSLIPFSYWPCPVSWFIHNLYTNSPPVYVSKPYTSLKVEVAQSCLTVRNPIDYTVHGILQARILERVTFPFSRRYSQSWDWTQVSCIAGGFFISWATLFTEFLIIYDKLSLWLYLMSNCACAYSVMSDSVTPQTVVCQAPLSMGFSRQK